MYHLRYTVCFQNPDELEWKRVGSTNDIIEAYRWLRHCNSPRHCAGNAEHVVLIDADTELMLVSRWDDVDFLIDGWEPFANTIISFSKLTL